MYDGAKTLAQVSIQPNMVRRGHLLKYHEQVVPENQHFGSLISRYNIELELKKLCMYDPEQQIHKQIGSSKSPTGGTMAVQRVEKRAANAQSVAC